MAKTKTSYSKTNPPKNNKKGGRKKKLKTVLSDIDLMLTEDEKPIIEKIKERLSEKNLKLSSDDWLSAWLGLVELSRKELLKVAEDDNTPMGIVIAARALIKDGSKGVLAALMELYARKYGGTKERVEHSGSIVDKPPEKPQTKEELIAILEEAGLPTKIFQESYAAKKDI